MNTKSSTWAGWIARSIQKAKEGEPMAKNKDRDGFAKPPIERHGTAAWANIQEAKPVSGVTVPSDYQVENAKEYVDSNEK